MGRLSTAVTSTNTQIQAAQRALQTDPDLVQLMRQLRSQGAFGVVRNNQQIVDALKAKGFTVPDGWAVGTDAQGNGTIFKPDTWADAVPLLAALSMGFAGGAYGAAAGAGGESGGAASAGSGSSAAGTGATIADPGVDAAGVPNSIASGGTGAASSGANAAAVTSSAAAGAPNLWKILAAAAPVIAPLVSAKIQANAQSEATQAQAQAAAEALAFLKQKYAQTQGQVAPYIASGRGALNQLDQAWGIDNSGASTLTGPQSVMVGANGQGVTMPGPWPAGSQGQLPALSASAPVAPVAAQAPTTPTASLASLAQQQNQSGVQPAQVGEKRLINGQAATWDGRGWSA